MLDMLFVAKKWPANHRASEFKVVFCLNKNGIEERDNDSFDHQLMKSLASAGDAQTASNYLENQCPLASIWYL